MTKRHRWITVCICLLVVWTDRMAAEEPEPADGKETVRVYFIGNSVTDMIRYDALAGLAASRGIEQDWGRHMIPGAPIFYLLNAAEGEGTSGFTKKPYGDCLDALEGFAWDAVSVQPFDRHIRMKKEDQEDQGDLASINRILELATAQNPDVRLLIMARWPRMRQDGKTIKFDKDDFDPTTAGASIDLSTVDEYDTMWLAEYTGGWDGTNESADYFDKLLEAVREANPDLPNPPALVPVGEVFHELNRKMKAGEAPGYETVYALYKDAIHLNPTGCYAVGLTYFAVLYGQDPRGLPAEPYGDVDPEVVTMIQETVWEVVHERGMLE